MYKIFIAQNVPSLNKGEMAILEGMLESFERIGEVEVAMLSYFPDIDRPRYGTNIKIIDVKKHLHLSGDPKSYNLLIQVFASLLFISQHLLFLALYKVFGSKALKLMRSEIWKEYTDSDVIIVDHDGVFGIGGGLGGNPVYFYCMFKPFFAKMLGKPSVLYGGSIGRFRRFHHFLEKGVKFVLSEIDLITLREDVSYQNLRDMGVKNDKVFVTADPVFLLQPASFEQIEKIMRHEGIDKASRPLIGMTITRQIASKAFPDLSPVSSYHKNIEMLAQVIDDLTSRLNATVIFIPHCIGFAKELDDRVVAADIFQMCKNKNKIKAIVNEYGPEELKGLIGQFDLFMGGRTHSVVNAMSMCVPSIVIAHSADQRLGIIKMVGQENAICYVEELDADTLISKIDEIWSEREKIKSELKSKIRLIEERAMLNGELLKELLNPRKIETH